MPWDAQRLLQVGPEDATQPTPSPFRARAASHRFCTAQTLLYRSMVHVGRPPPRAGALTVAGDADADGRFNDAFELELPVRGTFVAPNMPAARRGFGRYVHTTLGF